MLHVSCGLIKAGHNSLFSTETNPAHRKLTRKAFHKEFKLMGSENLLKKIDKFALRSLAFSLRSVGAGEAAESIHK